MIDQRHKNRAAITDRKRANSREIEQVLKDKALMPTSHTVWTDSGHSEAVRIVESNDYAKY
tara:strand:+ start:373 stop:555 length:183 start_codon:yes stop_codon:yes gene_type:complete